MTTGIINDQNLEKQIQKHMGGCMAGFFNLFDRNHVLTGKRVYIKRLPASAFESASDSVSFRSPSPSTVELEKPQQWKSAPSPEHLRPPVTIPPEPVTRVEDPVPIMSSPARSPVAVTSFEFKEGIKSPWKFTREAPRLSLDSRAIVDAKGKLHRRELKTISAGGGRCDGGVRNSGDVDESDKQKRSPSVIARLMGLDHPMPSDSDGCDLPEKKSELRRSASESRSRDVLRFVDGNVFPANQQYQSNSPFATADTRERNNGGRREFYSIDNFNSRLNVSVLDQGYIARNANIEPAKPWAPPQRKGLYNAGDYFPEPKPAVTIYGEIEKRLKMRGIEEPSQDLETLKQIFEALQLKGLLHSNPPPDQVGRRNFVYDRRFPHEESPIVAMKTARSPGRLENDPSPPPGVRSKAVYRRNPGVVGGDSLRSLSPRRDGVRISRNPQSPNRNPNPRSSARSENRSTSPVTARKTTATEPRRISPVQSPRNGSQRKDQIANQSPRRQRSTAEARHAEDEFSTISESSISSSSVTDSERLKMEDLKGGKSLLERCDKLLNSIAEITATRATPITELQPSPISVLDSSFYKEESSPSPVMKRTLDFKDLEDEMWSPSSSGGSFQLKSPDTYDSTDDQLDPDYIYVSEILRALNYLPDETDIFLLLEKKQLNKGKDASKISRLERKLVFDTVTEIIDRHRKLPPWKSTSSEPEMRQIWSELQRIHVKNEPDDLFEVICGVMKRDMAGDSIQGWAECHMEMSEAVLDVERLIFKDLIGETIDSVANIAGENGVISASRRKLVF